MPRPKKDSVKSRKKILQVRVTEGEYSVFQQAADSAGLNLSSWIRERCRRAAKKDLQDAKDGPKYEENN